jgi:uncharacterized protein (DUF1778 family)
MMASRLSESRIEFRIPLAAKRKIEKAAAAQGRTLSDFAKDVLIERAQTVLDEREAVRLSDRDRDIFLKMLDSKAGPNAALRAAARRQRERVVG